MHHQGYPPPPGAEPVTPTITSFSLRAPQNTQTPSSRRVRPLARRLDCFFSSVTARSSGVLGASPGRPVLLSSSPPAGDPCCSLPYMSYQLCLSPFLDSEHDLSITIHLQTRLNLELKVFRGVSCLKETT